MLFTPFICFPAIILSGGILVIAAAAAPPADPCAKIAGFQYVDPVDAIACQKSFPFNETLRRNVLSVVSHVMDFYTFKDFYFASPHPFQESTTDINAEIQRMRSTKYEVSMLSSKDTRPLNYTTIQDRL